MKILIFADLHTDESGFDRIEFLAKKHKPDLMIDCGDSSIFGEGLDYAYERLALLKIPMWAIHGNHEGINLAKEEISKHNHFAFVHKQVKEKEGIAFVFYGGGGFTLNSAKFVEWAEKQDLKKYEKVLLVTHQPPYGTKLDIVYGEHVGNKDFVKFIKKHKNVVYHFCGHIHDGAFQKEKIGNCTMWNLSTTSEVLEF